MKGDVSKMRIVTAAVIEKDGRILIARRKKGDHLENKWEFPGGKLEAGETPQEGLRRELLEEFGMHVEVGAFIGSSRFVYPHASIELLAYRTVCLSAEWTVRDHEEVRWVLPEELGRYDFSEADRPIVKKLLETTASTNSG